MRSNKLLCKGLAAVMALSLAGPAYATGNSLASINDMFESYDQSKDAQVIVEGFAKKGFVLSAQSETVLKESKGVLAPRFFEAPNGYTTVELYNEKGQVAARFGARIDRNDGALWVNDEKLNAYIYSPVEVMASELERVLSQQGDYDSYLSEIFGTIVPAATANDFYDGPYYYRKEKKDDGFIKNMGTFNAILAFGGLAAALVGAFTGKNGLVTWGLAASAGGFLLGGFKAFNKKQDEVDYLNGVINSGATPRGVHGHHHIHTHGDSGAI